MKHRILVLLFLLFCTGILTVQAQLTSPNAQSKINPLRPSFSNASPSDASSSDASPDEDTESRPPLLSTKKKEITSIFNLELTTKPKLIEVHRQDAWEHYLFPFQKDPFIQAYGITEDKERVLLKVEEFDIGTVNIDVPDTYYATLRFGVHELFAEDFYLPNSMAEYTIPIYITDPETFRLYYTGKTNTTISLTWTYALPDPTAELWYIESESPLTKEQLSKEPWTLYGNNYSVLIRIDQNLLKPDWNYYFQVRHSKQNSDILHLIYQNESIFSENIGGVRDEGGREEIPQPPITLPVLPEEDDSTEDPLPKPPSESTSPKPPSESPSPTPPSESILPETPTESGSSSKSPSESDLSEMPDEIVSDSETAENTTLPESGNNSKWTSAFESPPETIQTSEEDSLSSQEEPSEPELSQEANTVSSTDVIPSENPVLKAEEDTVDYTLFSGKRLFYMMEQNDIPYFRVKKNHIAVDIPWSWRYFDTLTDTSWLKVSLIKHSDTDFTFLIEQDHPVSPPEVTLYLPWEKSEIPQALIHSDTGHSFEVQYLEESKELMIQVTETGRFHLEELEPQAQSFFSDFKLPMVGALILVILFLILMKEKSSLF